MKKIHIENIDQFILIDDEDYEKVSKHKWHISYAHAVLRCRAFNNYKRIALPSYLTGKENSFQKTKGLDFRRSNIYVDVHRHRYRKPQKNSSSRFKGVSMLKNGKYRARIYHENEYVFLGDHENEVEAARAYNNAVIKYWNGNGYLNDNYLG